MYTLRRVLKDGVVENVSISDRYETVDRIVNLEGVPVNKPYLDTFKECFENEYGTPVKSGGISDEKDVHGFVLDCTNGAIYPLFTSQSSYIMTESGKTFEKL